MWKRSLNAVQMSARNPLPQQSRSGVAAAGSDEALSR